MEWQQIRYRELIRQGGKDPELNASSRAEECREDPQKGEDNETSQVTEMEVAGMAKIDMVKCHRRDEERS